MTCVGGARRMTSDFPFNLHMHFTAALRLRLKAAAAISRAAASDHDSPLSESHASSQVAASTEEGSIFDFTDHAFVVPASLVLCHCVRHAIRAGWADDVEALKLQVCSSDHVRILLLDNHTMFFVPHPSISDRALQLLRKFARTPRVLKGTCILIPTPAR